MSVVVTAEFHNPSILNPDFLALKKIVPEDWKAAEAITTPPVSIVSYSNGIRWTVEQSTLTVVENCGPSFQDEYLVHSLAAAYLEKLPHVPYRSLGLNWVVSARRDDPERWLIERFLKSGTWQTGAPKIVRMIPNFTVDAGDAVCNLSFYTERVTPQQGEPEPAVTVNSNVHHDGPLDADGLRAAIKHWPKKQEFVISALDNLLEGRLG